MDRANRTPHLRLKSQYVGACVNLSSYSHIFTPPGTRVACEPSSSFGSKYAIPPLPALGLHRGLDDGVEHFAGDAVAAAHPLHFCDLAMADVPRIDVH